MSNIKSWHYLSYFTDYGTQNPGQQLTKYPDCDCEWRYLKHYEAKGCRPVYEEKPQDDKPECTCPWRFDCSQADEVNADEKGKLYLTSFLCLKYYSSQVLY